jgi:hypothetical protein
MSKPIPLTVQASLAPQNLWQDILPWKFNQQGMQFGVLTINLGQTPRPDIEQRILDEVGSYGRQLGRIGDVLEVLLNHVKLEELTAPERDAIDILRGQLAQVRKIKRSAGNGGDDRHSAR